jgi:hypothetical protein
VKDPLARIVVDRYLREWDAEVVHMTLLSDSDIDEVQVLGDAFNIPTRYHWEEPKVPRHFLYGRE